MKHFGLFLAMLGLASAAKQFNPKNRAVKQSNPKNRRLRSDKNSQTCGNPEQAVMNMLACVEAGNTACVKASYASNFVMHHNEQEVHFHTNPAFLTLSNTFMDYGFDVDHVVEIGNNRVSTRFVETVKTTDGTTINRYPSSDYPFSQTFQQYKHALVELNGKCEIVLWNEYGDDVGQDMLNRATVDLMGYWLAPID